MKILFIILTLLTFETLACRPSSNFISPTIEENVKRANQIFYGKILAINEKDKNSNYNYQIEFEISENIKGVQVKKIVLNSLANSCNTFAQRISLNMKCLIFADKNGHIMSSLFDGMAAECEQPDYNGGLKASELQSKIENIKKLLK